MDRTTRPRYQLYPSPTSSHSSENSNTLNRAAGTQHGRHEPTHIQQYHNTSGTMGATQRNNDVDYNYGSTRPSHHRHTSSSGLLGHLAQEADNDRRIRKGASRIFKSRTSQSRSKKPLRASQKRRKAGITVDTTYNRHKGIQPKEMRRNNGSVDRTNGLGIFESPLSATEKKPDGLMIGGLDAFGTPLSATQKDGLSPHNNQSIDISPSDRPITIGLSVPTEEWSESQSGSQGRNRSNSDRTPYTPTIIITPASQPQSNTTSIYSHPPSYYQAPVASTHNAPPIPDLPHYIRSQVTHTAVSVAMPNQKRPNGPQKDDRSKTKQMRDSAMTDFEEDIDTPQKQRIMSSATLFEEDNTPHSATAQGADLTRELSYEATVPTPRRSRGWWNYITTPFEMGQNPQWPRFSPTEDKAPELPKMPDHLASAAPKLGVNTALPSATAETPMKSYFSASTVTSMASPWSRFGAEKSPISPDAQGLSPTRRISEGPELSIAQQLASTESNATRVAPAAIVPKQAAKSQTPGTVGDVKPVMEKAPTWLQAVTLSDKGLTRSQTTKTSQTAMSGSSDLEMSPVLAVAKQGTVVAPKAIQKGQSPVNSVHPTVMLSDTPRTHHAYSPLGRSTDAHTPPPPGYHNSPRPSTSNSSRPYTPEYTRSNVVPFFEPPPKFEEKTKKQKSRKQCKMPFGCCSKRKEKKEQQQLQEQQADKKSRKKKWMIRCAITWAITLVIVLGVSLGVTLRRSGKPDDTPVQNEWLNLTGYPPIPTGISTIARPEVVSKESGCVLPSTVWSCALPKEEQDSVKPNEPDQPNFRLIIRFQNSTAATKARRDSSSTLQLRQEDLFSPVPAPPNLEDQAFIGNTTDGNLVPAEGEDTPLFISFIPPTDTTQSNRKVKRQFLASSSTSTQPSAISTLTSPATSTITPDPAIVIPDIQTLIPPPSTLASDIPASATLLPLPTAQPLRLYNRGTPTEHYGFYTYFDRTIFLKSVSDDNSSFSFGGNSADLNGGSTRDSATNICTWSQTRFLVQIWTNSGSTRPLLSSLPQSSSSPSSSSNSSATNFSRPGSFPYPITITLDRHGGDGTKKMVYCYDITPEGLIAPQTDFNPAFVREDRDFGGIRVNPATGPFQSGPNVTLAEGGPGGIDGGTGGCGCQWANWVVA